eukprot:947914-Pelagomonas_calceolata.AAC.1
MESGLPHIRAAVYQGWNLRAANNVPACPSADENADHAEPGQPCSFFAMGESFVHFSLAGKTGSNLNAQPGRLCIYTCLLVSPLSDQCLHPKTLNSRLLTVVIDAKPPAICPPSGGCHAKNKKRKRKGKLPHSDLSAARGLWR